MSIILEGGVSLAEKSLIITPEIAMVEALVATKTAFLALPNAFLSQYDREQLLAQNSYDMCLRESVYALAYLQNKYPGLFDRSFLVTSYRSTKDDAVDSTSARSHTCLITKKGNKWFGASPANYVVGREETSLTTFFESDTVEGVLSQITERDHDLWPCDWPSEDFITHILDEAYHSPELVRDIDGTTDLRVFHLEKLGDGRQEGNMERNIIFYSLAA